MFFWNKICVIGLFLFICGTTSAQSTLNSALKGKDFILKNSVKTSYHLLHFTSPPLVNKNMQKINYRSVSYLVPQDFYTCNFGFFCKQELRVEKTIKIPLRFRLGSLQQCNYYEGKR